ncbi:hypothetical protein BON30_03405 [Cystobacter ferrugineus]|uniref:VCBS repeat-containing protein n=1 Tax=Cystobacter ferrugineus TaxID=83449 RepID=A0A1L9BJ60_9BACT|nr:hypothetical protein BON30_03405 [Cystobacter ferrugineus]
MLPAGAVSSASSEARPLGVDARGDGSFLGMDSSLVSSTQLRTLRYGTVGDFDGDGKLDLILTQQWAMGPMAMMKGLGNGFFLPAVPLALGFNLPTFPPIAADLDGDGALDLLWTGGFEQNLHVARGLGNGSFAPVLQYSAQFSTGSGAWLALADSKSSLAVADFDGNGSPDVLMRSRYGRPGLFFNQGNGTFGAFQPLQSDWTPGSTLATADLDGNGHQDVVSTGYGSTPAVLLSNGDGTFRTQQLTEDLRPLDSVWRDFDEDGHVDEALIRGSQIFLRRGDGLGGFSVAASVASFQGAPNPESPAILTADDLDGDGHLDLAVAIDRNSDSGLPVQNTLLLVKGLGDGSFAPGARLPAGQSPSFVTTGDFDGNGVSDVVTLQWEGRDVRVWLGGPGRTSRELPVGSVGPSAAGDFNGDGWMDVVSATSDSSTPTWQMQIRMSLGGPGGLSAPELVATVGTLSTSLQVAHVDADATLDVVLFDAPRSAVSLLGNGDGSLRPAATLPLGELVEHVESSDVNGDGKPDLVYSTSSGPNPGWEVRLLIGRGDGTFEPPVILLEGAGSGSVVLVDLDRDGKLDVVVPWGSNGLDAKVLMGRGDGSFTPGPELSLGDGLQPRNMRLADLDQDGIQDAVFCRGDLRDTMLPRYVIHVLKGTGSGGFTLVGTYPTQSSCVSLTLVDVDADGWRDVVASNPIKNSVCLSRGSGQGGFATEQCFGLHDHDPVGWSHLSVLDANGDGRLDLLSGAGVFRKNALLLQR